MRIKDLEDKQKNVNIDLKIIWDNSKVEEKFGKKIKPVIVVDVDAKEGDGSPSAYLDLYNQHTEIYKQGDKIRVIDAYAKLIQNNKGQFRLVNASEVQKIVMEDGEEKRTED